MRVLTSELSSWLRYYHQNRRKGLLNIHGLALRALVQNGIAELLPAIGSGFDCTHKAHFGSAVRARMQRFCAHAAAHTTNPTAARARAIMAVVENVEVSGIMLERSIPEPSNAVPTLLESPPRLFNGVDVSMPT